MHTNKYLGADRMSNETVKTKQKVEIQDKFFYKLFLGAYAILVNNLFLIVMGVPLITALFLARKNVIMFASILIIASVYCQALVSILFQLTQKFFYQHETVFFMKTVGLIKEQFSQEKLLWYLTLSSLTGILLADFSYIRTHFGILLTIPVVVVLVLIFFISLGVQILVANAIKLPTFKKKVTCGFYYTIRHFPLFLASLILLVLVWTIFEWNPLFAILFLPSSYTAVVLFINQSFVAKLKTTAKF